MTNPTQSSGPPESTMAAAASGLAPRRSSYASVVSGSAAQQSGSSMRSGAFSHLLNDPANPHRHASDRRSSSRNHAHRHNVDETMADAGHLRSSSTGSETFTTFSGAFGSLFDGHHQITSGGSHTPGFFIPSYLRGSRYAQSVQRQYRSRIVAPREDPVRAPRSPQPGTSLSTDSHETKAPAKGGSHRGMAYEVVEKAPVAMEESLPPLPTRWSSTDKHIGVEVVSDGLEIKFVGGKNISERDHEASAVRADHGIPTQCGLYYYEMTVSEKRRDEQSIAIGFSTKIVPLSRLPGWEPESWAYHGDDGHSFCCQTSGKHYGPAFGQGDTVGCGINFRTGNAFFTKNGVNLGTAFRGIKANSTLYPSIGMKRAGEHVRVNFGQSPFVFDIDGMMAIEKEAVKRQVESTTFANLVPGLNETQMVQALTMQYLTQEGYLETARAFASETYEENLALNLDATKPVHRAVVEEDQDAGHRQCIRTAILEGDVDRALTLLDTYFPSVLRDNENIAFRLKCRKFIEMIRQGAVMQQASSPTTLTKKGIKQSSYPRNGSWNGDDGNRDVDMDGRVPQQDYADRMDTDDVSGSQYVYQVLLQDTLAYGQALQSEFRDDPRKEVTQALNDAFSLMAYQDPLGTKEVSHMLDSRVRTVVAEEVNTAILLALGKSSTTSFEKLVQQTSVMLDMLRDKGGAGAFLNIDDYLKIQV